MIILASFFEGFEAHALGIFCAGGVGDLGRAFMSMLVLNLRFEM